MLLCLAGFSFQKMRWDILVLHGKSCKGCLDGRCRKCRTLILEIRVHTRSGNDLGFVF